MWTTGVLLVLTHCHLAFSKHDGIRSSTMSWIIRLSSYFPPKNTSTAKNRVFPGIAHFQTQRLFGFPASQDWGPADRISIPRGSEGNEGRKGLRMMLFWCHFYWDSDRTGTVWVLVGLSLSRWRLTLWDLYEIDVMMFGMTLYWYDTRVYCNDLCCSPIYHLAPVREVVLT